MRRVIYAASVFIFGLLISSSDSLAQYDPEKWPRIALRFSEQGTLKDVFDSGLRPYRFPTLERSLLEAKHARVSVVQRIGRTLPEFPAQRITMRPLQGGLLSSLEMTRYKTTLEESRALVLPYLPNGNRNLDELDRYLAAVRADYLNYNGTGKEVEDFKVRWSDPEGSRYAVAFRKAFDPIRPLVCYMMIDWSPLRTPRQISSFYKEPIPPPPGYEHVSMEAPEKFGLDSEVDIMLSQGKPISGDRMPSDPVCSEPSAATTSGQTPTPARSAQATAAEKPTSTVERKLPAWTWLIGLLAVGLIIAVAVKRRT